MSYTQITKAKFSSLLKLAVTSSNKAAAAFHEAGLFAVYQSIAHGNTTPALDLIQAMPKSQRRESMIKWLEDLSWCRFKRDAKGNIEGIKLHKAKTITIELLDSHMEKIMSIPYYEYSKEAKPEKPVWNFFDKLADLIKQAEKHMEKGDNSVIDPTDLDAVKTLAIKLALKHTGNVEHAQ